MAVISWGKPRIFIGAANATTGLYELKTPVEDSTQLTGEQGEKVEATIEGGEAEATKYKASTHELTMNVRMAKNRVLPDILLDSDEDDGYTKDEVSVTLQPENDAAPGFFCPTCTVSIMETFTAADGAMWEITFAPNKPETGGNKAVNWRTVAVAASSGNSKLFDATLTAITGGTE